MQIYVAPAGQQKGPYTREQVDAMLLEGVVVGTDLAWHQGMANWLPLQQVLSGGAGPLELPTPAARGAWGDLTQEQGFDPRTPPTVRRALWLIWLSLAMGVLRVILGNAALIPGISILPLLMTMSISYVLKVGLVLLVAERKNWARIVFLVLFILAIPSSIARLVAALDGVYGIVGVLQFSFQAAGAVMLFLRPSNDWFAGRPSARQD